MMLDGSHLFPMEQPQATAAAIEAALLNLQNIFKQKFAASAYPYCAKSYIFNSSFRPAHHPVQAVASTTTPNTMR